MILSQNFNHNSKPFILAIGLHFIIFFAIFTISSVKVEISNETSIGSFQMISFNDSKPNDAKSTISEKITSKNPLNERKQDISDKTASSLNNNLSQNNNSKSSSEVIYNAKNLGNPQPQYPYLSQKRGEEGTVLIRVFVETSGVASQVEIYKSSSFAMLDNSALETIKQWQFIPAQRFGQNIASSVIIPINFKLTQEL